MAYKPILFNTEMVRAILDGRKTQTRRLCKGQPQDGVTSPTALGYEPLYKPGDILWVRETWNGGRLFGQKGYGYVYAADYKGQSALGWRPSIHMPRAAARLFLRVTGVRIERLQDITPMGIKAEGVKVDENDEFDVEFSPEVMEHFAFEVLWDTTVKKADLPRYGWEANPWVWVIEFERMEERR